MASTVLQARSASPFLTAPVQRKPAIDHAFSVATIRPESILPAGSFLSGFSPQTSRALSEIVRKVSFPVGAIVFMEGEPTRGVFIVLQGRLKLLTTNSDGKSLIFKIAKPGDIIGANAAISGLPLEITAEALQPLELAYIGREEFVKFIKEHGDACLQVAQHLGRDCHSAYEVIRSIGLSHSVEEKLARFLVEWSSGTPGMNGVTRVKLSLTHEEIAQVIGCSRESVSRTFSDLKKKGLVEVKGATLTIKDKESLERLATL
jgi:CRP/FNR family transcriptional regulator, cyclic AMP receptor protein